MCIANSIFYLKWRYILNNSDYSNRQNWLKFGGKSSEKADIFVVYPTVIFTSNEKENPFVRLENEKMRIAADKWLVQIDDIISQGNVFVPIYRQLNGSILSKFPARDMHAITNQIPRDDIFAAFEYYLTNINKNKRPFILLGHSQGSQLVMELATTFLGNEKYADFNKNHIATYAIGVPVSQEEISKNKNLKFSEKKDDLGVIISWNCASKNENFREFISWKDKVLVNNPVSWGIKPNADIIVTENKKDGVLFIEADETKFNKTPPFVSIFHTSEIPFFKDAIKQNIKNRTEEYYAGNSSQKS